MLAMVRLVNSPFSGRLEVFHDGEWGTVCDDGWDLLDASVVCRELGYWTATAITNSSVYGEGAGHVWVRNVQCTGNQTSLRSCPSMAWQSQTCGHDRDVGIVCKGGLQFCSTLDVLYG